MLNEVDVVAKFGSGRAHEQELLVFDGLLNDFLIAPELLDLLLHVVVYPWPLRARANDFIQTKILDRVSTPSSFPSRPPHNLQIHLIGWNSDTATQTNGGTTQKEIFRRARSERQSA